jgi:hypothetical protein
MSLISIEDHNQVVAKLEAEKLALELDQRQWNALFHQLDAVIGAALIDKENWQDWLESYMDNADTPYHLYTDAEEFHRNYTMQCPLTIDQHKADIARLNAVFAADLARGDEDEN